MNCKWNGAWNHQHYLNGCFSLLSFCLDCPTCVAEFVPVTCVLEGSRWCFACSGTILSTGAIQVQTPPFRLMLFWEMGILYIFRCRCIYQTQFLSCGTCLWVTCLCGTVTLLSIFSPLGDVLLICPMSVFGDLLPPQGSHSLGWEWIHLAHNSHVYKNTCISIKAQGPRSWQPALRHTAAAEVSSGNVLQDSYVFSKHDFLCFFPKRKTNLCL